MTTPSPESQAAFDEQSADARLSDREFRTARLWFHAGYDVAVERVVARERERYEPILEYMRWGADHTSGCSGEYRPDLEKCGLFAAQNAIAALDKEVGP